jgi:hypothetical protein
MLRKIYHIFALVAGLMVSAIPVYSQSANLIAAGKKEGKAVVYGSLESDATDKAISTFKAKSGIDVEYWRASATKVMNRG